jgi:hypothetical protein
MQDAGGCISGSKAEPAPHTASSSAAAEAAAAAAAAAVVGLFPFLEVTRSGAGAASPKGNDADGGGGKKEGSAGKATSQVRGRDGGERRGRERV